MSTTIETLEQTIKDGELLHVRIKDRIGTLQNQYKQTAEELQKLGVNPSTALEDIQKKEAEFQKELQALNDLLPSDIIAKYQNYNFGGSNGGSSIPF